MKTFTRNSILTIISILLFNILASAQTHKSHLSPGNEGLPMNRAAFIFCYNNATYSNPAEAVLNKQLKPSSVSQKPKTEPEINTENISMFSNLTEDELWVQLNEETVLPDDLSIEIYNATGQKVYHSRIERKLHKINVCDFTAGTFLIKTGDIVKKMVIE